MATSLSVGRRVSYAAEPEPVQADVYVSTTGNDANPGTEAAPVATISRARNAVRDIISAGLTHNIVVQIQGGIYPLTEPLVFDHRDSGTKNHSITYLVTTNQTAILSGGVRLTGWQQASNALWTTTVPDDLIGSNSFRYLFVNGRRATRARTPNSDSAQPFLRIVSAKLADDLSSWEIALPPDKVAAWKNVSDMEIVILMANDNFRKRVQSVDAARGILYLQPPHIRPWTAYLTPTSGMACYLENTRAFLDEPGEWYLDQSARQLWYWPRPDEQLESIEVCTPVLTKLLQIQGSSNRPVANLSFDGLSFAFTTWMLPDPGYICWYTNYPGQRMGAIEMAYCNDCSLLNCNISQIGGDGIKIKVPTKRFMIQGATIHDISGHGIYLPGPGSSPLSAPDLGGTIANNHVYDCGVEDPDTSGISCATYTKGLTIKNNLVYDLPYMGITLGDRNSLPSLCQSNVISGNYVHHVMRVQSDGGGIYEIGPQSNCTIRANVVTDVLRGPGACGGPNFGIYMDERSAGCHILENVVSKTTGQLLHFNCDPANTRIGVNYFGENVFYKGKVGQYSRSFANDRFMDIPHAPALDPQHLTVEAWIRPLSFAGGNDPSYWLVSKNGAELSDGHYSLLTSHNNIGAYLNIGGGRENCYAAWSHDSPLKSNEWSHVAMTYDGTNLSVFCNGALAGLSTVNRQRSTGSSLLRIGKRADSSTLSFAGLMDDVRIYNRALSAEVIAEQYAEVSRQSRVQRDAVLGNTEVRPTLSGAIGQQLALNSQPFTNSLQTQDPGLRTQDSVPKTKDQGSRTQDAPTLSSQVLSLKSQPSTVNPSQPVSGLSSQVSGLQSSVSSLQSTSGLVLHLDFTAMHDQMEKIIAEAGPEEPYKSRFAASRESRVEGPVPVEKGRESKVESLVPVEGGRESRVEIPVPVEKGRESKVESPVPVEKGRKSKVESPVPVEKGRESKVESPVPVEKGRESKN